MELRSSRAFELAARGSSFSSCPPLNEMTARWSNDITTDPVAPNLDPVEPASAQHVRRRQQAWDEVVGRHARDDTPLEHLGVSGVVGASLGDVER